MTKAKHPMKKEFRILFTGLFLAALIVGLMFLLRLMTSETLYVDAYKGKVEQANEYRRLEKEQADEQGQDQDEDDNIRRTRGDRDERGASEPRPYGFREKDIDKAQGARYRTF